MGLDEDLTRIAEAVSAHGSVTGVLAAEPAGGSRLYVVSLGEGEERRWLVVDDGGRPVDRRTEVRNAASIVAMCELAGDVAGGGDLAGLRVQLERLREVERPEGIDAVEEAVRALEHTVGEPPRVATPAYLDAVGQATQILESALGDVSSPFAEALRSGTAAVDEFVREVERGYALPLR